MKTKKETFAVIPAYNEEKHIEKVVLESRKYVNKVIVVDDGSKDKTLEIAKKAGALVLIHTFNLGLGAALKTGCEAALSLGADIIITIDGDCQHDASEIPMLIKGLTENNLDIVFGEREFQKMPFVKRAGNYFFYLIGKAFFKMPIIDTQTGFRAFTKEAYEKIKWDSPEYSVAFEIVKNCRKNNLKVSICKINTIYIDNEKGTNIIDGLKIFKRIIKI